MNASLKWTSTVALLTLLAAGCNRASQPGTELASAETASPSASIYRLSSEPVGAKDVKDARGTVKDGEEVVVVGRIGGDRNPWVEGTAAFTIVDVSLKPCEDGCDAPWDYCCEMADLPNAKAMVKIVDEQGQAVAVDSRKLLGVKEMQTVVTRGKAKRDDAGNLTILASGIFVRQ